MPLNPRQARFVDEYMIDLNATQAAIRAGYSAKTAGQIGFKLLKEAQIAVAIAEKQGKHQDKLELTAELVLLELKKLGFSNMQDYMRPGANGDPTLDFSKLTRDQAAALSEVTVDDFIDGRGEDAREVRRVKFKLADKRAALVDLGRHLGLFKEKVEVTGKDGGAIQHESVNARDLLLSRITGIASRIGAQKPSGKLN